MVCIDFNVFIILKFVYFYILYLLEEYFIDFFYDYLYFFLFDIEFINFVKIIFLYSNYFVNILFLY